MLNFPPKIRLGMLVYVMLIKKNSRFCVDYFIARFLLSLKA